ncbi:hypothetical protein [Pyrobaculum neutrophilum]|uniref:Uncharacterized protein n=1 Tax=Pyrobaculum neutrophilum (strain DSM 2338 / JCM 9278 / NBRC 100436 / V24Sta) TaxID=444157 RepID=B1YD05_PYRNV|nr:hypothetical protein [Pyrobaculum neutrophilum]ACB39668.1 hypothetical protein Tneu_0729 [Pyrobaculum neutrophilum V24Sta]
MKWVTHYVWAALPLISVYRCSYLLLIAAYAIAATKLTDVLAHGRKPVKAWRGGPWAVAKTVPYRTRWHDPWAVATHSLTAASVAWIAGLPWALWAALGALGGLTHVFLDRLTPGKRAISWVYNAPALVLGLLMAYYLCLPR